MANIALTFSAFIAASVVAAYLWRSSKLSDMAGKEIKKAAWGAILLAAILAAKSIVLIVENV